jgi:Domain of unknown function (DUF1707)/Cell wall-active antibiotics response 4TMS YvqF
VSNLPEPTAQGHLRVSDADREQAAEVLRTAAGDGRLTLDELDERLAAAYAAKTYADLEAVTGDLPGPGVSAPVASAGGSFPADRIGGTPGAPFAIAIMGGARRRGRWVVPRHYTCFALMGGVDLDLREAQFAERDVTIQAFSLMGGVNIVVPEDIEVDVSGIGIMGGFDHRASGPGAPGAPRVKVIGLSVMGGVDVRRKPLKPKGKSKARAIPTDPRHQIED